MRYISSALLVAVLCGCRHDGGFSFDPRVARETLEPAAVPCVATPASPQ